MARPAATKQEKLAVFIGLGFLLLVIVTVATVLLVSSANEQSEHERLVCEMFNGQIGQSTSDCR